LSNRPHARPRRSGFCAGDSPAEDLPPTAFGKRSRGAVERITAGGGRSAECRACLSGGEWCRDGDPESSRRPWPIRHSISLPQGGQDTAFRPAACMFVLSNSDFVISEHCTTDGLQKRQVPSGSKPRFPSAAESSMSRTRSSQLHGASAFFQSQLASRQSAWAMSRRESARSPSSLDLANLW